MSDLRGIPLNDAGPIFNIPIVVETAESGFTVGSSYEMLGLVVDNAEIPPKPYALAVDNNKRFRLIDIAKVRRG